MTKARSALKNVNRLELALAKVVAKKKAKDEVAEVLSRPRIDLSIDASKRPFAGVDIVSFRARHGLDSVDTIYALCIQTNSKYNALLRAANLAFDMEMLIRIYDLYPSHAPWKILSPRDAFTIIYGDLVEQFRRTPHEEPAKFALYNRFTAACGRSLFTAYRWLGPREQGQGRSTRSIEKIFGKLSTVENPRAVFEETARLMYKARGLDLDKIAPLPTLENPPVPRRRGPIPKAKPVLVAKSKSAATKLKTKPKSKVGA